MQGTGLPQAPTVSECQSTEKPTQPLSGEVLGSNLFGATVGKIGNSIDSLSDLKIAKRSPCRQKAVYSGIPSRTFTATGWLLSCAGRNTHLLSACTMGSLTRGSGVCFTAMWPTL